MKIARGFRGKYFSLQAITATVSTKAEAKNSSRAITTPCFKKITYPDDDEEEQQTLFL